VHHRAESHRTNRLELYVIPLSHVLTQISVACLQTSPGILQVVGPDPIFITIFPIKTARGNRLMSVIDQDCFDARRSQLNAEGGIAVLYCLFKLYYVSSS